NPVGALEFNGLSTEVVFLKGTLDKLGVEPQIFKVGDFKSAVEPFVRKEMSEPSRIQTTAFINSIYDHYLAGVAEARGLDTNQLSSTSSQMLVKNAEDALEYKLVTSLGYVDEVRRLIKERLGIEEDEEIDFIAH